MSSGTIVSRNPLIVPLDGRSSSALDGMVVVTASGPGADVCAFREEQATIHARIDVKTRMQTTINGIMRDVRFSLRNLLRTPGFALVVALSLGLGIGANTAIFSLIRAVLVRSLPVERPEELVLLHWFGDA